MSEFDEFLTPELRVGLAARSPLCLDSRPQKWLNGDTSTPLYGTYSDIEKQYAEANGYTTYTVGTEDFTCKNDRFAWVDNGVILCIPRKIDNVDVLPGEEADLYNKLEDLCGDASLYNQEYRLARGGGWGGIGDGPARWTASGYRNILNRTPPFCALVNESAKCMRERITPTTASFYNNYEPYAGTDAMWKKLWDGTFVDNLNAFPPEIA